MPLALTTKAKLALRAGSVARLEQYFQGDDNSIDAAIWRASDMFRSAALNQYTAASIDALTDVTATPEVALHIESLALGIGTSGDDIQPETITRAFDHAREWLRWLAGGSVHIDGLDPVGGGGAASGGSGVRYRSRTRLIDRDAEDGDFDARDPRL